MDIKGEIATLNSEEQTLLGCESPIHIGKISLSAAYARLTNREDELSAKRAADDDELMHYERAAIVPDALQIRDDRLKLNNIAQHLVTHEATLALED